MVTRYLPVLVNGVYSHPWPGYAQRGLVDVIKWKSKFAKVVVDKEELDRHLPVVPMNWDLIRNPNPNSVLCTWIGHASMLIQMDGKNILADPIFSNRCAPTQWIGPQRVRPTPCAVSDLPRIDMVLISHNHYDHLDHATVVALGNTPQWIVPMGMKKWFESCGITNVVELSWSEQVVTSSGLTVVSAPCQHWSRRGVRDVCKALWCSFVVLGSKRVYFSGDTAYCPAFKETGEEFGPFDLACIPIGAYEPRDFMCVQHVDPEEAVQMHIDLKSKHSVGMHWGTFILTDEPVLEPPQKMAEARRAKGLPDDAFIVLYIGETKEF